MLISYLIEINVFTSRIILTSTIIGAIGGQTCSQRVQLAISRGPQLYYKRFSRGIQISGTFGLHHVCERVDNGLADFFL
jgi:hypothetical protein